MIQKSDYVTKYSTAELPQWLVSDDDSEDDNFYGFSLEMIERESRYFDIEYSLDTRWYDLFGDDSDMDDTDTFEGFSISDV